MHSERRCRSCVVCTKVMVVMHLCGVVCRSIIIESIRVSASRKGNSRQRQR